MARKKNVTITFYHGESLKTIHKNTAGLFPLYIRLRYGSETTKLKSITASKFFEEHRKHFNNDSVLRKIEEMIHRFKFEDERYISQAKRLFEDVYPGDDFNLQFLSNTYIQKLLTQPIPKYFEYLITDGVKNILMKNGMVKVSEFILPSTGVFNLFHCLDEIDKEVKDEINSNDLYKTIFDIESEYSGVSFLDFYFIDLSHEGREILTDLQLGFKAFLKQGLFQEEKNLFDRILSFRE